MTLEVRFPFSSLESNLGYTEGQTKVELTTLTTQTFNFASDPGFTLVDQGTPESWGDGSGHLQTDAGKIECVSLSSAENTRATETLDTALGASTTAWFKAKINVNSATKTSSYVFIGWSSSETPHVDYSENCGIYLVNGNPDAGIYLAPTIATSVTINYDTDYWIHFEKTSATGSSLKVYEDSGFSTQHGSTITVNDNVSVSRSYFQATCSLNVVGGRAITSYMDDLQVSPQLTNAYSTSGPLVECSTVDLGGSQTIDYANVVIPSNTATAATDLKVKFKLNGGSYGALKNITISAADKLHTVSGGGSLTAQTVQIAVQLNSDGATRQELLVPYITGVVGGSQGVIFGE